MHLPRWSTEGGDENEDEGGAQHLFALVLLALLALLVLPTLPTLAALPALLRLLLQQQLNWARAVSEAC